MNGAVGEPCSAGCLRVRFAFSNAIREHWGVSDEPITTWIFNKSCPEMKEAFWVPTGQAPTSVNAGSCQ